MTIIHKLPAQPEIISDYNKDKHSLTRIIDSTIHTIYLKNKTSIQDLDRLSRLDNEAFILMAYLQKKKD